MKKQKMARSDEKIEKSQKCPTLRGHHRTCKPFYKILANIPKILHVKNEADPVENKKLPGAMFW
jgi:hypothetical protein